MSHSSDEDMKLVRRIYRLSNPNEKPE